jgi:hypothetical protein
MERRGFLEAGNAPDRRTLSIQTEQEESWHAKTAAGS